MSAQEDMARGVVVLADLWMKRLETVGDSQETIIVK